MGEDLKVVETEAAWSLKGEHRLREGGEEVQSPATPQRSQNHNEDDHHGKRSVFARVKDKAKKWRNSFGKKKNGRGEATASSPRESSPREEGKEEDRYPEFHGAPMYETVMGSPREVGTPNPRAPCGFTAATPRTEKEPAAVQKPGKERPNASKNKQEEILGASKAAPAATEANPSGNWILTQMLTPAYNMVSNATQAIASKLHGPPEAAVAPAAARDELGAKQGCDKLPAAAAAAQVWDKGVSVKEFLVQKLQPGEDERALSQVITEAMSPRKAGSAGADRADQQGTDVVEKLKGAVSSLLGKEELISSPAREEASAHGINVRSTTVASPAKAVLLNQSEPSIPISKNPNSDKDFM